MMQVKTWAINPFAAMRSLENDSKSVKFETLKSFCLLFRMGMRKDFDQNTQHWKQMCYRTRKKEEQKANYLQVHVWNFTCWGSELKLDYSQILHSRTDGVVFNGTVLLQTCWFHPRKLAFLQQIKENKINLWKWEFKKTNDPLVLFSF